MYDVLKEIYETDKEIRKKAEELEELNNKKKKEIRDKFDNKCILCGKTKEENNNRELSVHHIDRNKDQGCNGHGWDLVPLCSECHGKVHGKKEDYWRRYIKFLVEFGYIDYKQF